MKNPIHILNRFLCFPLLLVVGIYFLSSGISVPVKKGPVAKIGLEKAKDGSTNSSKSEIKIAFIAVVQVFHGFVQPILFTCLFLIVFLGFHSSLVPGFAFPQIGFFRHLFTHVIATNAP